MPRRSKFVPIPTTDKKDIPLARLTLVIEWPDDVNFPEHSEVEEILDKAREYAQVKQATFETFKLMKKELV